MKGITAEIQEKISLERKMKNVNLVKDDDNDLVLEVIQENTSEIEDIISDSKDSLINTLHSMDELVKDTKDFKMYQLAKINKLDALAPKIGQTKNIKFEYYKEIEPYELMASDTLKNRITKMLLVIFLAYLLEEQAQD